MAKEVSKAIWTDLNLRIDIQNASLEKTSSHLRSRRISVRNLTKRRKLPNFQITNFSKITSKGVMGNKQFWNTVKPFLTSKGFFHNEDIAVHIGFKIVYNRL